ncbi:MAG: hypothetical protein AAFR21_14660 [Pseudomonadota bacterium]
MRFPIVLQLLAALSFLKISVLLVTAVVSTNGIYYAYQKYVSGVIGTSAESRFSVRAMTGITELDEYTYAGQLDATIVFSDAEGAETVFDLHYPEDYNLFHDGFGPLWLANMRADIANNPQATPVLGNSCLQTKRGENLAPSPRYRTGYKEYLVCRVLDEEGPDAPRLYDISKSKPAVIGIIWANHNHQPIDNRRERCVAEARIWSTEVAKPRDRFMACVFVVNEALQQVETFAFELTENRIIEVGGGNESWSRAKVKTRASPILEQYRLIQNWLSDEQSYDEAVDRAYDHIVANLDQVIPTRESEFSSVERRQATVNFTFRAKDTEGIFRIRDGYPDGADRHLYQHIRPLVCGSDERAALLAFQENRVTYTYALDRSNGEPLTLYAVFPNLPC